MNSQRFGDLLVAELRGESQRDDDAQLRAQPLDRTIDGTAPLFGEQRLFRLRRELGDRLDALDRSTEPKEGAPMNAALIEQDAIEIRTELSARLVARRRAIELDERVLCGV